ncbi:sugar O-acetyltransferase [uncultured Nocardioides sp.]|uniref:sugar O-acetyltransferase n=1 Tax=uncultured Nocardioides sp. TaxID=198441 RepID=UPI002619688D|nr:sugar O-acetyltransferase [uncultured Nocardioides sp.]
MSDDTRSMRERMLAGEPYMPDEELGAMSRRALGLVDAFNATGVDEGDRRKELLTELLGGLGTGTEVRPPLRVDYGTYLTIGDHGFVNFGLVALDCAPITIGEHVQIGPNVQLLTPTHPVEPDPRRDKWEGAQPITIGDNVWLGGGAIVCPGVTIGDDTVVGAGSVVTKDLPAGVVAVGNPARVIKRVID